MIPASQLDPRVLRSLVDYLRTEVTQSLNDRQHLEKIWAAYEQAYRAEPEVARKDFPFQGAANLVLPVIATDVDTVYSRLMGILFAPENLWSCKPLNPAMIPYAPRLQEFLQWAQHTELGVYNAVADWLLELTKLGTGVLKQRYTRQTKRVYQWRETDQGLVEQHLSLMLKDHPTVEHVSLVDFLVPATTTDLASAPWCAERISLTWQQLQQRVREGVYQGTTNLQQWYARDRGSTFEQLRQRLDRFAPGMGTKFDLWECWLDYDILNRGEPQGIVVTIHLPSMTVLRIDYNPFFNQEKPYSVAKYLRQNKRFYGIGLAEMLFQFQEEVSTMHNQRLDNATLANSTMMKARRNIGIKQNEPIFPGRWFLLDNLEDIQPMSMGQKYDSTVPYEQMTLQYASRRTGVSDYVSGESSAAVGYQTATGAVQQLREGAKRFDQVMRECRICLGETGTRVVELYQQFNQGGKEYLAVGPEDGALVHQILQFPMELIRGGMGIELTATSATMNKEVEIRTNTLVMQMLMQFYQQLMQGMSYIANPQVPDELKQIAAQMVRGGTTMMRKLLDNYGMQDVDTLVPQLEQMNVDAQQQLAALLAAAAGASRSMAGPPAASGMAAGVPASDPGLASVLGAGAGNGGGPNQAPAFAGAGPGPGQGAWAA